MLDVIEELRQRIGALEERMLNICRMAKVTYVYKKSTDEGLGEHDPGDEYLGYVDLEVEGLPLQKIPFTTYRQGLDKTFWLPSVDEMGILLSPCGDLANAFFTPGFAYNGFPIHVPDGDSTVKAKRVFRDGSVEEIDVASHYYNLQMIEKETDNQAIRKADAPNEIKDTYIDKGVVKSEVKLDSEEILIERSEDIAEIKIDGSETKIERNAGVYKEVVATNMNELSAILMNLIGAHFFPSGITTVQSPVGPCFFAPAPSPASPPSPPSGSSPSDGKVTKIPASRVNGITVHGKRLTMSFTLPSIPVTTPAGPGTTTPTPLTLAFNIGSGELDLTFPAKDL